MAYNKDDNSQLRSLQLTEVNILKLFAEICEKHHLRYYMVGGTMLGAIRHKGFIPWDEDMDVGMPRPDYEKFMAICRSELPDGYDLRTFRQNADYKRAFSKLVDKRVTITNDSNVKTTYEYAWLDIFPFDGMPKNRIHQLAHFWHMTFWRFLYRASCFDEMVNLNRPGRPLYLRVIIKFLQVTHFGSRLDTRKLLMKLEKGLARFPYDDCEFMVSFFGQYMTKEIVDKKLLGKGARYPFEGLMLIGPEKYHEFLTQFYGDYMTPPKDSDKNKLNISSIEYNDTNKTA